MQQDEIWLALSENGAVLNRTRQISAVDEMICAALRGQSPAWPWADDPRAMAQFQSRADLHGVNALLHRKVGIAGWPAEIRQAVRDKAVQLTMWELRHQQVLAELLDELDLIGVQPILIKGTALAYQLYPSPALRTRGDTDLLIPAHAKARVDELLLSVGYQRGVAVSGEFVSYQASYTLQTGNGGAHTLDLHWKINNSELLSRLFTYEELRRTAEPLPALRPGALGACRVHALLLACMHRSTHKQNPYYVNGQSHHKADRLIWLYDVHLLAQQLTDPEWEQLVQLATQKGLRAVCLEGMRHAQACFHTQYPPAVIESLSRPGAEPPARYLDGGKLRQQWMDFVALGSCARQLQWLREQFFPSAAYMQTKYPGHSVDWLPWLYLRRAADGFAKRLVRGSPGP